MCNKGSQVTFLTSSYLEYSHDGCREGVKVCGRSPIIKVEPEKEIQREWNENLTPSFPFPKLCHFHHPFPLSSHPCLPYSPPIPVTYEDGFSDYYRELCTWRALVMGSGFILTHKTPSCSFQGTGLLTLSANLEPFRSGKPKNYSRLLHTKVWGRRHRWFLSKQDKAENIQSFNKYLLNICFK